MSTEEQKTPRELWVEALRSGKYEQDKEALQGRKGFCCLGVLCKVAEDNGIDVLMDSDGRLDGSHLGKQKKVWRWSELANQEGAFKRIGEDEWLTQLNDAGKSFSEIADIIESEPEGLFL